MATQSFPVHFEKLLVDIDELNDVPTGTPDFREVCGITSTTLNSEDTIQTYNFNCEDGFSSNFATASNITFNIEGRRVYGDVGQDAIRSIWFKLSKRMTTVKLLDAKGGGIEMKATLSNITPMGGATEDIEPMNFDVLGVGKPIEILPPLTSNLQVDTTTPTEGETGIPTTGTVVFNFNKGLSPITVEKQGTVIFSEAGSSTTYNDFVFSYSNENSTLTLTYGTTTPLESATLYSIALTKGIISNDGNTLPDVFYLLFTTV